jgi:hypothetical protein
MMTKSKIPPISELPIIPLMIAERAVWNVLEDKYPTLHSMKCVDVVELTAPLLEARFERHYRDSDHFRESILNKRKDMRFTCEMFMEHWTLSIFGGRDRITPRDTLDQIRSLLKR